MKVKDFKLEVASKEGKIEQVNIAQIGEVIKVMREIILEKGGVDLYKDLIHKL